MTTIVHCITSAEIATVSLELALDAWSVSVAWGQVYTHVEEELLLRVVWPIRDPVVGIGDLL